MLSPVKFALTMKRKSLTVVPRFHEVTKSPNKPCLFLEVDQQSPLGKSGNGHNRIPFHLVMETSRKKQIQRRSRKLNVHQYLSFVLTDIVCCLFVIENKKSTVLCLLPPAGRQRTCLHRFVLVQHLAGNSFVYRSFNRC